MDDTKTGTSETVPTPNKEVLQKAFEAGYQARCLAVKDIEQRVEQAIAPLHSHPALKLRIKEFDSYYKKYLRLRKSGITHPNITDLMGIRIVCLFIEDIASVIALIKERFDVIETEQKGHDTFKEFGYESTHLLIKIPADIVRERGQTGCEVAEIQIRTILQDAWAEVEHELFYKAEFTPYDSPMKRKLAAVNASLSLADIIFQEINSYQKQLYGQLGTRRGTFYQKIEESADAFLFSGIADPNANIAADTPVPSEDQALVPAALASSGEDLPEKDQAKETHLPRRGISSIDDLLLDALYAHNKNNFTVAVALYTQILELKPENSICSIIYKHRGMAHFAQSKYQDAIGDFTHSLELGKSYKAAYYRGVVHSVLKQYAQAIDDYTISLEINPIQAFCLFRRGQAYYHVGDYLQALSDCETSLSMEPQNEAAQKFRTLLQNKLKM
jgi:putative GTP pyrophosphokinase